MARRPQLSLLMPLAFGREIYRHAKDSPKDPLSFWAYSAVGFSPSTALGPGGSHSQRRLLTADSHTVIQNGLFQSSVLWYTEHRQTLTM